MKSESSENGLDELTRLSQKFKEHERESIHREKRRAEQRKKVQGLSGELRKLTVSIAVEQLIQVATPEIVEQVNSLNNKLGTAELRKLITDLLNKLENNIDIIASTNPDLKPADRSVKTLNILVELLFSLE
jgi:predicted component of type VI protein secretion system